MIVLRNTKEARSQDWERGFNGGYVLCRKQSMTKPNRR